MFKYLLFILCVICCTSCYQFRYTHHQPMSVFTDKPSKIAWQKDTFVTKRNKTVVFANFNKPQDTLYSLVDSIKHAYLIKNIGTKFNWYGNPFTRCTDSNSANYLNRIYKYPAIITLLPNGTIANKKVFKPAKKGSLFLNIDMPYCNNLAMQTTKVGYQNMSGFIGYALGASYYTTPKNYWSGEFVFLGTAPLPFGPISFQGEFTRLYQQQMSVLYNVQKHNLHLGVGAVLAKNNWLYGSRTLGGGQGNIPTESYSNISAGLAASIKYSYLHGCFFAMQYKPTVLIVQPKTVLAYQHSISIGIGYRIKLKQ
jgi:hypothetical protein